jgi:hypothetical protein
MSNPDGVLAAIDACLDDYAVSDDAMRWAPDEPDPTPESVPFGEQIARFAEQNTGFPVMDWQRHYLNALTPAVEAGTLTWDSDLTPPREAIFDAISAELETPSRDGLLRITMPDASETCHRVLSMTPGEIPGEFVLTLEPANQDAMGRVPDEPDPAPEGSYAPGGVAWSGGRWPITRDEPGDALEWETTVTPTGQAIASALVPTSGELLLIVMPDVEHAVSALSGIFNELRSAAETALEGFGKAFAPVLSATANGMHRAAYRDDRKHIRRCPACNPYGFPKPLPVNGHEYHRRQRRRSKR